jgi:hypothetical protein
LLSAFDVRDGNVEDFVESTCSFDGRIDALLEVCCADYDDVLSWLEAVHGS